MSDRQIYDACDRELRKLRVDFPALAQVVNSRPLIYLDSASTALKPRPVIAAISDVYTRNAGNVHRGVHALSVAATTAFEAVREQVREFIGASDIHEIVFTKGTTEAINLVAQTWGRQHVAAGDAVLVSELEHHSNLVPWQMLCQERGAHLDVLQMEAAGGIDLDRAAKQMTANTRIVAISHVSNALGSVLPVRALTELAHAQGAVVLVDGAQAVAHLSVDVQALGCDFYAFSGHKLYGPSGVGVLYGRRALLEAMPPWQGGGDMIESVSFAGTRYRQAPYRFEAGTPPIASVIGLGAAIDYLNHLDRAALQAHEAALLDHGTQVLRVIDGLTLYDAAQERTAILSFGLAGIHPHDIATVLDQDGIAVRAGHHCAQPLMERLGVSGTVRASLGLYSTREELDALGQALARVVRMFHRG